MDKSTKIHLVGISIAFALAAYATGCLLSKTAPHASSEAQSTTVLPRGPAR